MLLPTGAHLKKWKKWLVQDLKVSQNWPECYTSNTVSSTSREGKANIKWLLSLALSLPEWARGQVRQCLYSSRKSHQAPNMLQKNCLCQYTYRSINCSRVSSSPIPWSLHSLSWISSVVVSPSVLVNHGMLGVSTAGSLHTNTLLPIPQGSWEKMFVNDQQHCSQSHSSSLCQRKEEPEQYDQNCRDMSKYNMNFLKTLQLHKSRCIPSLQ